MYLSYFNGNLTCGDEMEIHWACLPLTFMQIMSGVLEVWAVGSQGERERKMVTGAASGLLHLLFAARPRRHHEPSLLLEDVWVLGDEHPLSPSNGCSARCCKQRACYTCIMCPMRAVAATGGGV